MTKGMDTATFVTEAAGQVYKQTAKFVYIRATVCENADHAVEINRRLLVANLRLRPYGLSLYNQSTTPLPLEVLMFKAKVMEPCYTGVSRGAPP